MFIVNNKKEKKNCVISGKLQKQEMILFFYSTWRTYSCQFFMILLTRHSSHSTLSTTTIIIFDSSHYICKHLLLNAQHLSEQQMNNSEKYLQYLNQIKYQMMGWIEMKSWKERYQVMNWKNRT